MEGTPENGSRARGGPLALGAVTLLTLGVGLGFVSGLPFEWLETRLDALAWDGDAEPFTRGFYAALQGRLRLLAAGLALSGGVLWRARLRAASQVSRWVGSLRTGFAELARDLASSWRTTPGAERLALAAVCGVAALARLAFLFHPLRRDEAFTFNNFVSQPLLVALSNTAPYYGNNNHLLNTVLAKLSVGLLGDDPWAIRLPALVAGTLLVPAVYAAGRALYGRGAGLLAAALVAVSPYLVARSTDARGYAWVMLFAVVCLASAARAHRRPSRAELPALWSIFAIAAALGFYAVPTMLYPFGGVALWTLWNAAAPSEHRAERLFAFASATLAAGLLTLLLYAPVLAVSGIGSLTDNHWVQPLEASRLVDPWAMRLPELGTLLWNDAPFPVAAALASGFALAVVGHRRLAPSTAPLWPALLLWCAGLVAVQRVAPWTRVWSFLVPLYLIIACGGVAAWLSFVAPRRGREVASLATACLVALSIAAAVDLVQSERVYADADSGRVYALADAAEFIAPRLRQGDCVVSEGAPGLVYELEARGVARERFLTPRGREARVFVFAASRADALARLGEHAISQESFGAPELLARFERYTPAAWFRFQRKALPAVSAPPR